MKENIAPPTPSEIHRIMIRAMRETRSALSGKGPDAEKIATKCDEHLEYLEDQSLGEAYAIDMANDLMRKGQGNLILEGLKEIRSNLT